MANLIRRRAEGRGERGELATGAAWDPFRVMRELMRFDPFRELETFGPLATGGAFIPTFDVTETKDGFVFQADMPGIKEEDLDISLTENTLIVSGRRESEQEKEDERYHSYERSFGTFQRSFTLPPGVDPEGIRAELNNGVLRLEIGKRPEVQPRRISLGKGQGPSKLEAQKGGQQAGQQGGQAQGKTGSAQP